MRSRRTYSQKKIAALTTIALVVFSSNSCSTSGSNSQESTASSSSDSNSNSSTSALQKRGGIPQHRVRVSRRIISYGTEHPWNSANSHVSSARVPSAFDGDVAINDHRQTERSDIGVVVGPFPHPGSSDGNGDEGEDEEEEEDSLEESRSNREYDNASRGRETEELLSGIHGLMWSIEADPAAMIDVQVNFKEKKLSQGEQSRSPREFLIENNLRKLSNNGYKAPEENNKMEQYLRNHSDALNNDTFHEARNHSDALSNDTFHEARNHSDALSNDTFHEARNHSDVLSNDSLREEVVQSPMGAGGKCNHTLHSNYINCNGTTSNNTGIPDFILISDLSKLNETDYIHLSNITILINCIATKVFHCPSQNEASSHSEIYNHNETTNCESNCTHAFVDNTNAINTTSKNMSINDSSIRNTTISYSSIPTFSNTAVTEKLDNAEFDHASTNIIENNTAQVKSTNVTETGNATAVQNTSNSTISYGTESEIDICFNYMPDGNSAKIMLEADGISYPLSIQKNDTTCSESSEITIKNTTEETNITPSPSSRGETPPPTEDTITISTTSSAGGIPSLDKQEPYQPIRIRAALTSHPSTGSNYLTTSQRSYLLNKIVNPALIAWSRALSIVPVKGNLTIDIEQLFDGVSCGPGVESGLPSVVVPQEHLIEGVKESDLLVYLNVGFYGEESAFDKTSKGKQPEEGEGDTVKKDDVEDINESNNNNNDDTIGDNGYNKVDDPIIQMESAVHDADVVEIHDNAHENSTLKSDLVDGNITDTTVNGTLHSFLNALDTNGTTFIIGASFNNDNATHVTNIPLNGNNTSASRINSTDGDMTTVNKDCGNKTLGINLTSVLGNNATQCNTSTFLDEGNMTSTRIFTNANSTINSNTTFSGNITNSSSIVTVIPSSAFQEETLTPSAIPTYVPSTMNPTTIPTYPEPTMSPTQATVKPSCSGTYLASATYCSTDQYDRPIAGLLHFCITPDFFSEGKLEQNIIATMHELGHILGFNSLSMAHFRDAKTGDALTARDSSGDVPDVMVECTGVKKNRGYALVPLPSENILQFQTVRGGVRVAQIVTPTVSQIVKNHFDCPDLMGAELESEVFHIIQEGDLNGSAQSMSAGQCISDHWERRLFKTDLMNPNVDDVPFSYQISPLTLAYFLDSGWYKIDVESSSHASSWGRGAGCGFVKNKCITDAGVVAATNSQFFCNSLLYETSYNKFEGIHGCTTDLTRKAVCSILEYEDNLPSEYQYFSNSEVFWKIGGQKKSGRFGGGDIDLDYCPVYNDLGNGLCSSKENNKNIRIHKMEEFGIPNSRCVMGQLWENKAALCLPIACVVEDRTLRLKVDGSWKVCNFAGEIIPSWWDENNYVVCPDPRRICPTFYCPRNCLTFNGAGVCDNESGKCLCDVGEAERSNFLLTETANRNITDLCDKRSEIYDTGSDSNEKMESFLSEIYIAKLEELENETKDIFDQTARMFTKMSVGDMIAFIASCVLVFLVGCILTLYFLRMYKAKNGIQNICQSVGSNLDSFWNRSEWRVDNTRSRSGSSSNQRMSRRNRNKDKMVASMLVHMRMNDPQIEAERQDQSQQYSPLENKISKNQVEAPINNGAKYNREFYPETNRSSGRFVLRSELPPLPGGGTVVAIVGSTLINDTRVSNDNNDEESSLGTETTVAARSTEESIADSELFVNIPAGLSRRRGTRRGRIFHFRSIHRGANHEI